MRVELKDTIQLYKGMVARHDIKNDIQKTQNTNIRNFDQIEIRGSNLAKEQIFFDQMVQKVKKTIEEDTKDDKITRLKEQMINHQYTFDVTELVSKILIEKGEQ